MQIEKNTVVTLEYRVNDSEGFPVDEGAQPLVYLHGGSEGIFDLIEENTFKPLRAAAAGHEGPYRLRLSVFDGRLSLEVSDEAGVHLETLVLGLGRFRRPIRDYFAICDSYYQAIRKATAAEIETIDMARRGVHNEAAELLLERLEGKVQTDFATARRLFTLICVLHIRG